MKFKTPRTIRSILMPVLSAAVVLLVVGYAVVLSRMHHSRLRRTSVQQLTYGLEQFDILLEDQTRALKSLTGGLARDPVIQKELLEKNVEVLTKTYMPLFRHYYKQYGITHFYFHGTDRVNLVRLHNLPRNGDVINRFTMLEAELSQKNYTGIELGILGTFTLRSVEPVYCNGKLAGYIELGKEIEDILASLNRNNEFIETVAIIDKLYLAQSQWAVGMKMLSRQYDWNSLRDKAIIYSSMPSVPCECFRGVSQTIAKDGCDTYSYGNWQVMVRPLRDASGLHVGELAMLRDIRAERASFKSIVAIVIGYSAFVSSIILGLLYVVLGKVDASVRRHQSAVAESRLRLLCTLRSIGDGVITTDINGNIISLNPAAEKLLGRDQLMVMGKSIQNVCKVLYPSGQPMPRHPVMQVLKSGRRYALDDYSILITDGQRRCRISDSCAPISDADGNLIGAVFVFRDVSEEYKRIEELRISRERFSQVCDYVGELVWEIDVNGVLTYVNRSWSTLLGYDVDNIIGRWHLYDVAPDDSRQDLIKTLNTIIQSQRQFSSLSHQVLTRDGRILEVVNSGVPIYSSEGVLQGYRGAATDVTEAIQTTATLERLVDERSADVYRLLRQTDEFVNRLGHDLRTPLTPLVALLPLVEQRVEDKSAKKMLALAINGVEYMRKLVESVLMLAKLNASEARMNQVVINLSKAVDDVIAAIGDENSDSLAVDIINLVHPQQYVQADAAGVIEVLRQLITNAVRFSSDAGKVTVTCDLIDDELAVCVQDSGMGMTAEQISRAFEEFYKADDSRHDRTCPGLGLSICQRIISMHGGRIWIESDGLDKGTSVYFTLVRAKVQSDSSDSEQQYKWAMSCWKG